MTNLRKHYRILIISLCLLLTTTASVSYRPGNIPPIQEEETVQIIVRLAHGKAPDEILLVHATGTGKAWKFSENKELEKLDTHILNVPASRAQEELQRLGQLSGVLYAEPDYPIRIADTTPDDTDFSNQYALTAIRAPQGWDISTGSDTVIIAIIDTGVDYNHPDLAGKIVSGYDFIQHDSIAQDDNGHGTHVAGIAAAASNNAQGIAGVSWGARIMPVKVLNSGGGGVYSDTASGIMWAAEHGAQIINLSIGEVYSSYTLQNAVDYAIGKGCLVIAASGNDDNSQILYPARYPKVMAVAATDASNQRASFSTYGPEIDIAAPGDQIYSLDIGGYATHSGTSMAVPHVAGLAAVLWGVPGNDSAAVVRYKIESSALDIDSPGWDAYTGAGLIQMDAALLADPPSPPSPIESVVFLSQASYDGWIRERAKSSEKGGIRNNRSKVFFVGDDKYNRQYRSILSFDTADIPDNAIILKVKLRVKKAGLVGTNPFKTHKGLRVDISRSNFGTFPQLQRSDFQVKASRTLVGRFSSRANSGWYTSNLSNAAYSRINKTGVTQFRLRFYKDDNNDNSADYFKFYSGDAIIAYRPQLVVDYYIP